MASKVRLVAVFVVGLVAACYNPKLTSGSLTCSKTGKPCPDGFHCAAGHCYKDGDSPPAVSDLGMHAALPDFASPAAPDLAAPPKMKGDSCGPALACAQGLNCVDGVCCTSPCTGSCEACDVTGSVGDCVPVTGPPHGNHPACNGKDATCGGSCDGTNRACAYPSVSQICGAACDGHCDGSGSCSTAGGSCPNGFACGAGGCKTTCSGNGDCQTHFHCTAPNCTRDVESDCLDGLDNNGDGLIDCADPTCTTVMCVSSIPGDEIGTISSSCSDSNYPTPETFHQTLSSVTCTGCGCSATGTVQSSSTFYTGSCGSGPVALSALDTGNGVCVTVSPPTAYAAFDSGAQSVASTSCSITQQAAAGTPQWGVTTNFCVARQSPSTAACGSTKACVAKPANAAKVCVRIPSAGASCPAGYGNSNGTYYTGFNPATCNGCTCTSSTNGNISSYYADYFELYTTSNCSESFGKQGYPASGACVTYYDDYGGTMYPLSSFTVASVRFVEVQRLPVGFFTCSSSATVSAQAQPTGGSTMCCQ